MKEILFGLLAVLVGTIIFKIFLPWWLIAVVMGLVILLTVHGWVIKVLGLDPIWGKRIALLALVVLLISIIVPQIDRKSPWLGKATESRGIYSSFKVTDWVDPKYPETLAMALYRLKTKLIEMEEIEQAKKMDKIYKKIEAGKKPDQSDRQAIETAEKRFSELDKKSATTRLSRSNGRAWLESVKTRTLPPKIFWFGVILLVAGLTLKFASKKKRGGAMIGLGIFILFIALAMTLFEPEIKAGTKAMPKARAARPLTGTFEVPEKIIAQFKKFPYKFGWTGGAANGNRDDRVSYFSVTGVKAKNDRLTIYYAWKNGRLVGTIRNGIYNGKWHQSNGRGDFFLKFNSTFSQAKGWWNDGGNTPRHFAALK